MRNNELYWNGLIQLTKRDVQLRSHVLYLCIEKECASTFRLYCILPHAFLRMVCLTRHIVNAVVAIYFSPTPFGVQ